MKARRVVMDNRLAAVFADLAQAKRKAFVAYLCAGDPSLAITAQLVPALAKAGVDVIELGFPYSDPMADGPSIQAACDRALKSGTTVAGVLASVKRIREKTQVPIVAFTYINPVLKYGVERFAADAVAAGIDGILPLDLPPDAEPDVITAFRTAGLANVCLSAPTTPALRARMLARESRGFLYYVCRLGVTGERSGLPADLQEKVLGLKAVGDAPVCIGFGISTPEQAAAAAGFGDGVVIGSHLVNLIHQHAADPALIDVVAARARVLAEAVHAVKA